MSSFKSAAPCTRPYLVLFFCVCQGAKVMHSSPFSFHSTSQGNQTLPTYLGVVIRRCRLPRPRTCPGSSFLIPLPCHPSRPVAVSPSFLLSSLGLMSPSRPCHHLGPSARAVHYISVNESTDARGIKFKARREADLNFFPNGFPRHCHPWIGSWPLGVSPEQLEKLILKS